MTVQFFNQGLQEKIIPINRSAPSPRRQEAKEIRKPEDSDTVRGRGYWEGLQPQDSLQGQSAQSIILHNSYGEIMYYSF